MDPKENNARIGEAWKAHYQGEHQAALQQFEQLAQELPDHIDAQWGLGLTCRKLGEMDKALRAFKRVKELLEVELGKDPENVDRLAMLSRMVTQQIEQISDFIS